MGDLLQDTRTAIGVFDGDLVVGNHDSLTLFGTQSQIKLRDYSKAISKLFLNGNDQLEPTIDDVVLEIEKFQAHAVNQRKSFGGLSNRHKELAKEYTRIISYMERVVLFFQLQQAHLLKEISLLETLSTTISESIISLERCIASGEKLLRDRSPANMQSGNCHSLYLVDNAENIDVWYTRLDHRLEDLRVSHIVALQNREQIKILYENNLVLLDRISSAISNTFPVWQSQMVMMLGIERLEKRSKDQDKAFRISSQQDPHLDVERITVLNSQLKAALAETASLEKKDLHIRKGFQEAIHYTGRG